MKAILFLSLVLFSNINLAADVGYEVEVIIFEDASELYKNSEHWPVGIDKQDTLLNNEEMPVINKDVEVVTIKNQTKVASKSDPQQNARSKDLAQVNNEEGLIEPETKEFFEYLNSDQYRLNEQALKLRKHKNYRVLYHKAWKQPGLDKASALPIMINTNTNTNTNTNINTNSNAEVLVEPNLSDETNLTDTSLKTTVKEININDQSSSYVIGDFTLIMSRYLHVLSSLVLYKPQEVAASQIQTEEFGEPQIEHASSMPIEASIEIVQYPLLFERRMRSKEIHYIDHPMGGMIVLAIPYKIEEEQEQEEKVGENYQTL